MRWATGSDSLVPRSGRGSWAVRSPCAATFFGSLESHSWGCSAGRRPGLPTFTSGSRPGKLQRRRRQVLRPWRKAPLQPRRGRLAGPPGSRPTSPLVCGTQPRNICRTITPRGARPVPHAGMGRWYRPRRIRGALANTGAMDRVSAPPARTAADVLLAGFWGPVRCMLPRAGRTAAEHGATTRWGRPRWCG